MKRKKIWDLVSILALIIAFVLTISGLKNLDRTNAEIDDATTRIKLSRVSTGESENETRWTRHRTDPGITFIMMNITKYGALGILTVHTFFD